MFCGFCDFSHNFIQNELVSVTCRDLVAMSTTLPQSREYEFEAAEEEDKSHAPMNSATDKIVNLEGYEDGGRVNDTDQALSHVIVETVQYEDYFKQGNGEMMQMMQKDAHDENRVIEDLAEIKQSGDESEKDSRSSNQLNDEEEDNDEEEEVIFQKIKRPRPSRTLNDSQEKQVITLTLRCDQVGCGEIDKEQFTKHMWNSHSISAFRCLVKDCEQSFKNKTAYRHHRAQSHESATTTEWHCYKCPKHFSSYQNLCTHNHQYHQLGHFQCSFPTCTFTGEWRRRVYDHYQRQHKQSFKCFKIGCHFECSNMYNLERHQCTHLAIKPYKCKWAQCDYAATRKDTALKHIRRMHLTTSSDSTATQLTDPKVFLEVLHELLH